MIPFSRVIIVGLGLMGGSWALALRRSGFDGVMIGVDPDPAAGPAAAVVDELTPRRLRPDQVRPDDLVVLALPLDASVALARETGASLPDAAVITDVGSAKRKVCAAWAAIGCSRFVGGHPMAGSERAGFAAADAGLFDDVPYFLVRPPGEAGAAAYERVATTVRALGARPVAVDPAVHDRDVALTSHLPQVLAWTLDAVVRDGQPSLPGGPGLRDMTRLAASRWPMWSDVLAANGDLTQAPLDAMISRLIAARDALASGDHDRLHQALAPSPNDPAVA